MFNTTRDIVALATVCWFISSVDPHGERRRRTKGPYQDAEGKSVGTPSLRETKDGVA